MGNRICGVGRGRAVEERLTRPQRLARQPSNVDYRKLRKLILSQKLAPCFDALEDPGTDLEECPICFFYYPSLNRSRCCSKGICTECFLQMKPSNATRPAQCPFCKTSCYAVEYRGAKTKEEKELELAEDQKVIEAKIRMQSQESQNVEQAMAVNQVCSISDVGSPRQCLEEQSTGELLVTRDSAVASTREDIEADSFLGPNICHPRPEEWDVDLEEIMVMEAIWLSLQDSKLWPNGTLEASGDLSGADGEVNQTRPCQPLDQPEASSSGACPLEDERSQFGGAEPISDFSQVDYKPCEDSTCGSAMDIKCLDNCSFPEEDPRWGPAQLVEETHVNGETAAFVTQEFSSLADVETRTRCSGYVHSVSTSPCDSPAFSNHGGGLGFPQLPCLIVERQMMIAMESNA